MNHAHTFHLASPNGPTSLGLCACGEEREYPNYTPMGFNGLDAFRHRKQARASLTETMDAIRRATEVVAEPKEAGPAGSSPAISRH